MNVFVYGTLTDSEQIEKVLTEYDLCGDAVLEGLHREAGTYPTLAPGGTVAGRLLETPEIGRLDRYEGVERELYVRVAVPIEGGPDDFDDFGGSAKSSGPESAAVYIGDPAALDVETKVEWPGEGPLRRRVERYVREHTVQLQRR